MPELPEVEIAARNLRRWLLGKRITGAELAASRVVRGAKPAAMARLLSGRTVEQIARKGKWLRLALDGGAALYSHLGMTGKWVKRPRASGPERWERARLDAGATSVRYLDPRLFGRLIAAPDGEPPPAWRALGPDPLADGIDVDRLAAQLGRTRRSIKEALLDQKLLPGVGNIVATEALWRARVDPRAKAFRLARAVVAAIARGVLETVRETIAREQAPEIRYVEEGGENPFAIYAREGEPCPRDRARLQRLVQGGRSTVFCPRCQTHGRAKLRSRPRA
jgi:formamidopyrimidine-DNA glycosylase